MKLPNSAEAVVETAKLTDYLLSEENSGGKAAFFLAVGFSPDKPQLLRRALLTHGQSHDVVRLSATPHGLKVIIEGELAAPDGRKPQVRSVWIIEIEGSVPRLITAYPLKE
jgi:hypothetical protein